MSGALETRNIMKLKNENIREWSKKKSCLPLKIIHDVIEIIRKIQTDF